MASAGLPWQWRPAVPHASLGDVYMSDFGELEVVPHYLMAGATDVHLINTDYCDVAYLDGFKTQELGTTGDSEKVLVTVDCGLMVRAPKALAKCADLTGG